MRRLIAVFVVLLGVAALVLMVRDRAEVERAEVTERVHAVRTIEAPSVTVVPRFTGYGTVAPSQVWNAVAQVSGEVTLVEPSFEEGNILARDQFLLQIDPTDFELAIAEAETNIESVRAQIAELQVREENSRASLAIERESLTILALEVERKQKLISSGAASSSELERERRSVLTQRQSIQNLENALNLYPAERRRLEAELARNQSKLQSAQLDLKRARMTLPFTGRIAEVEVERFQFVRQGDRLAVVDAIAKAEIEVQVPLWRLAAIVRAEGITDISELRGVDIGQRLGVAAEVYLDRGELFTKWDGRVARFRGQIDPQSRTVGVIVEVEGPYTNIQPGIRPPLVKGLFTRVELRGRPRPDSVVVPRVSMNNGQVYVVGTDNRLEKRHVSVGIHGASYYSISDGIEAGETIVVSDLIPAIEGMLLEPMDDVGTLDQLITDATADVGESQ